MRLRGSKKGPNLDPFGLSEDIFSVNGSILASALARQMDTFKSVHLLCFGRGPMATKRVPIKIHLGFQRAPARHTTTITAKQQQTIAAHHHNRNKSATTTTTPFKQPPLIRHRRNKAETKASTPFKKKLPRQPPQATSTKLPQFTTSATNQQLNLHLLPP